MDGITDDDDDDNDDINRQKSDQQEKKVLGRRFDSGDERNPADQVYARFI